MTQDKPVARAERLNPVARSIASVAPHLVAALLFSAAVNVLFLASPLYMMQLYSRVLNSRSIETLISLSIALVLALLAMAVADAARGRLMARAGARIDRRLARTATDQALRQGRGGTSAALSDIDIVRRFLGGTSATTLLDAPFTLLFLFVLYLLHPLLGLVATIGAVAIIATVALARIVDRRREARINEGAKAVERLSRTFGADRGEIRALGLQAGLTGRLVTEHDGAGAVKQQAGEMSASVGAAARFVRMMAHSGTLAVGAVLALNETLTPAAMLAAAILAGRALGPTETLLGALRHALASRQALARLSELMATAKDTPAIIASSHSANGSRNLPTEPLSLGLEAAHVVAARPDDGRAILRSLSFSVKAGEVIAVAGPSGSGKSTLARCLTGAMRLKGGAIRLGQMDISGIDPEILADRVGWLPQEVDLFAGTVFDNVTRFGRIESVVGAVQRFGLMPLIERLPQGLGTMVEPGGANLTPAMRQGIGLIRALIGPRALVVLDQPTSHQDAEGELVMVNVLRQLKANGITTFVISHKPVMAAMADRIMLLRDGTIEVFEEREKVVDSMRARPARQLGQKAPLRVAQGDAA